MIPLTLLLLVYLATPALAAPPARTDCPVVEPGRLLVAFPMGAPQARFGPLKALPDEGGDGGSWVQPAQPAGARLRFEKGALIEAEIPLPTCVTLGGKPLPVASPHHLATLLGTCGPRQINQDYDSLECEGARIVLDAKPTLQVFASKRAGHHGGCATYLFDDHRVDAVGVTRLEGAFTLEASDAVCVDQVRFGPGSKPTDLAQGACKTEALRGGTHVTCGRFTYRFGGPQLAPTAIQFK
ncbi:MAG: hypothetical protein KC613_08700 [Myxococcales bacterium]|nr:hypothetical protein [Myxococcales bacterium]